VLSECVGSDHDAVFVGVDVHDFGTIAVFIGIIVIERYLVYSPDAGWDGYRTKGKVRQLIFVIPSGMIILAINLFCFK